MTLRAEIRLDVFSHNVKISRFGGRGYRALQDFCNRLIQYGVTKKRGRFVRQIARIYATATQDRSEYRFHINHLEELITHLKQWGYLDGQIEIIKHNIPPSKDVALKVHPSLSERDYQVNIIDYFVSAGSTKMTDLQTGKGKSFCCMKAVERIGKRAVLVIKGMYVEKWLIDLNKTYVLNDGDLMVVRGSRDLRALIDLAIEGTLRAKFIIVTSRTIYSYLKLYEAEKKGILDQGYGCVPEDLYDVLGAGVRIMDEVHQEFHGNFKQDLYTNIEKTISLSATLKSDDKFVTKMYEVMFPIDQRFNDVEYDKYIGVKAFYYRFDDPSRVRWIGKQGSYSQVMFEQSILMTRNKRIKIAYFEMITDMVENAFIDNYEKGQKLLIFAGSVNMCTELSNHLQKVFSDKKVSRYISDDDYSNLIDSDIMVSTIKSAGTAVDIPNLTAIIMTDGLSSIQANEQAKGRLRKIKDWPELTPVFFYLVCRDINQHITYHEKKKEDFHGRVLYHKEIDTNYIL